MYKIIFAVRRDFTNVPGGDTTQIIKSKEYLENLYNLKVEICTNPEEIKNFPDVKLVHIFDLRDDTIDFIPYCKEFGKKVALSTIFWDLSHARYVAFLSKKFNIFPVNKRYYKHKDFILSLINIKDEIFGQNSYGSKQFIKKRRYAIENADVLLPNSYEELNIVANEFGFDYQNLLKKSFIVPNAVDINLSEIETETEIELPDNITDFVMEAARIEPIKNQLNIILALMDEPQIPILFVGAFRNKRYKGYFNKVKKLAKKRGNVYFIDHVPHEKIYQYYKKARVHVMPSFRESTGLSSLETLVSGTEIVTASNEYCPNNFYEFDKYGHICNPYDPESIKKAILEAYSTKKNNVKKSEYLDKFSYNAAAEETYKAYKILWGQYEL
jgi:glycosyltransferase involved in cell wall biosynthesis